MATKKHAAKKTAKPTATSRTRRATSATTKKTKRTKTKPTSTPANSLVGNINKRKKAGTSRSKANSTISKKAYREMKEGWPAKKSAKRATTSTRTKAKK